MRDDMKVSLGKMKDGKKDGKWTEWYNNGRKELEGTYKKGRREGKWTWWYENGQKQKEGTYKKGRRYGLWTIYMEDGWKLSEIKYIDDDNYEFKTYNKDGSLDYSHIFKDGKIFSGVVESFKKTTVYFSLFDANVVIDSDTMIHNHYENGEIMKMVYLDNSTKDTVKVEDCTKGECEEVKDGSKDEENNNDDTHLSLILDRMLPEADNCQNNNYNGLVKINFGEDKNLIPYDEPYPISFWLKVVDNLINSGAAYIIFNSEVSNISSRYKDILKQYPNVYRTVKNSLTSSSIFHVGNKKYDIPDSLVTDFLGKYPDAVKYSSTSYSTDFCPDKIGDIGEYPLAYIIDTKDVDMSDPTEDLDWMGQFIPGKIPEWIEAIEDLGERQEVMELMGVGGEFDVTKSPFYKQVVLIGF